MNRQSSSCQKQDRYIYRCQGAQGVQADGAFANLKSFVVESELKMSPKHAPPHRRPPPPLPPPLLCDVTNTFFDVTNWNIKIFILRRQPV